MGLETRQTSAIDGEVLEAVKQHGASTLADLVARLPEIKRTSLEYSLQRLTRKQALDFYNVTENTKRARVYFIRG